MSNEQPPIRVIIGMRKARVVFLVFLGFLASQAKAQLNVTSAQASGNWADYYVNQVLLGVGVQAFNATFSGDSVQIGEFALANTSHEIPDGVILSSGNVNIAVGPNTNGGAGVGTVTNNFDSNLFQLGGNPIFDAAILEFDFVPQGDSLRFNYIFSSEEYEEYVCATVNDAFGFFLSGPGISGPFNGAINLAIIPNTSTPVSINTVNPGVPGAAGDSSNCAAVSPTWFNNTAYYHAADSADSLHLQYDGFTVLLTAKAAVTCSDTYHIKMVIGDGGDPIFDSGVFIQGGSFSSNLIDIDIATVNGDSTINEGCGEATISFNRADTCDTAFIGLEFSGTAQNGIDFNQIPDSVILLPGVADSIVVISPFFDALNEGVEFFTITATRISSFGDTVVSSGTFYIYDIPNLIVEHTDTIVRCPTDSVTLTATVVSGGPPPYTYAWSTGQTTPSITVPLPAVNGIDTLILAVEDSCALFTILDTVLLERDIARPPGVTVLPDTIVTCEGDSVELQFSSVFGSPPLQFVWSTGDSSSSIQAIVNGIASYSISLTDSCGRQAIDTASLAFQSFQPLAALVEDTVLRCPGDTVTLKATTSGGIGPYSYAWAASNPQFTDSSFTNIQVQNDTATVFWMRDVCGRVISDTANVLIEKVDPMEAEIPNAEAICDGVEITMNALVEGGLSPYSYVWSTGDTSSSSTIIASVDQQISIVVRDFCGRQIEANAIINTPEFDPLNLTLSGSGELCFGEEYTFSAFATGGAGGYRYEWIPLAEIELGEIYDTVSQNEFRVLPFKDNIHVVRVTDFCGLSVDDSLMITVDHCVFIPNVVTPNQDGLNDAFIIDNIENFPDAHLYIYNRWGTKIFESQRYRNEFVPYNVPSGTYFYILSSDYFDQFRGSFTVIRD